MKKINKAERQFLRTFEKYFSKKFDYNEAQLDAVFAGLKKRLIAENAKQIKNFCNTTIKHYAGLLAKNIMEGNPIFKIFSRNKSELKFKIIRRKEYFKD